MLGHARGGQSGGDVAQDPLCLVGKRTVIQDGAVVGRPFSVGRIGRLVYAYFVGFSPLYVRGRQVCKGI